MSIPPCPCCGGTDIRLLIDDVARLLGPGFANRYCKGCGAQAPQDVWGKRSEQQSQRIQELEKQAAKLPDPAYDRHTSELLDSQAYQLEQIGKAVLDDDYELAKKLAQEALS